MALSGQLVVRLDGRTCCSMFAVLARQARVIFDRLSPVDTPRKSALLSCTIRAVCGRKS